MHAISLGLAFLTKGQWQRKQLKGGLESENIKKNSVANKLKKKGFCSLKISRSYPSYTDVSVFT